MRWRIRPPEPGCAPTHAGVSCTGADTSSTAHRPTSGAWLIEAVTRARSPTSCRGAAERKLARHFSIPHRDRRGGPAMADDRRWAIARRFLHDSELELADRVAGCPVLLYGQQLSHITPIRRTQVTTATTQLRLRTVFVGTQPSRPRDDRHHSQPLMVSSRMTSRMSPISVGNSVVSYSANTTARPEDADR